MGSAPSTDRGRSSRARIIDTACDLFYRRGGSRDRAQRDRGGLTDR